jgi:hypothetical protein
VPVVPLLWTRRNVTVGFHSLLYIVSVYGTLYLVTEINERHTRNMTVSKENLLTAKVMVVDMYFSSSIFRMIKSRRRRRLAGNVARMRRMLIGYWW